MFSPYSPANSPAIQSPRPVFDITPPPVLGPAPPPFVSPPSPLSAVSPSPSAPPVTSPATSAPPTLSSTVPLPKNSAPPVTSPGTSVPQVPSSPSPKIVLVPASSPLISSDKSPDSPILKSPPSPATLLPPAVPWPSPVPVAKASQPPLFPFAASPVTRTSSPSATAPPTAIFPQRSTPPLPKTMSPLQQTSSSPPAATPLAPTISPQPLPTPFTKPPLSSRAAPSIPTVPASSPEVKLHPPATVQPPSSLTGSFPVAVEVQKPPAFNISTGLIVGLVIGVIIFVFVIAIVSFLCGCGRDRKKKKHILYTHHHEESSPCVGLKGSDVIRELSNPSLPPHVAEGNVAIPNHASSIAFGSLNSIYTYEELLVATNCFMEANLLGQGGFGYVYKGVLPRGKAIAVKQLKTGSQQGEREFQAEVETISRVHHKHLVELVGYCVTSTERFLVYEFVPNNTLEFHLHGEGQPVIDWATRIKIAVGSAKGLAYLHEDCNPAIIHRDIKASNILLDFKFEAKVSDFGLAKIFPNTDSRITHLTTRVVGTFGYLAPEYASSGKLTDKSDVYSYGVMLLELITGRPPIIASKSRNESLVDWARPLLAQALQDSDFNNLIDPRLQKNYVGDEMATMITCAAACVRHSARLRPRMSQIVGALEGVVSLTDLVGDIAPGHTPLYSWSESSNYDASQYQQDIRNFNLALSCQKNSSSGHSESTSAYGLPPSGSSSEVQQTIDM